MQPILPSNDNRFSVVSSGNLTTRRWLKSNGGLEKENACYDNLNRLTNTLVESSGWNCTGTGEVDVAYDALGNITSKSDVCASANCMSYGGTGAGPHALGAITGSYLGLTDPVFAYDPDGNMTCVSTGAGCTGTVARTATWNSFNMAASIAEGANGAAFTYDSEHQRIKMVATGANAGTTLYLNDPVSGAMEESVTATGATAPTWRDYILADGHMIALRTQTPSTNPPLWGAPLMWGSPTVWTAGTGGGVSLLYFVLDHLGSISVVTDSTGTVVERDSYDAWGKRRNADGTAANCGTVTSATTRGFTGQEMMDAVCLINFNARIYDPTLGRFMSADPTTETVYNLQILNRYSYVGNNPLSLTDPSGLCFLGCFWHSSIFKAIFAIVIAIEAPEILGELEVALGATEAEVAAGTILSAVNVGIAGGLAGFVTTGKLSGALTGALQAELFLGVGDILQASPSFIMGSPTATTFVAHGFVGGLTSVISGGKFASGFLAAGIGSLADAVNVHSLSTNAAIHAIAGGLGSVLGGGKFENGAITGAFGYLFNKVMHPWSVEAAFDNPKGLGGLCYPLQCVHTELRVYKYDNLVGAYDGGPNDSFNLEMESDTGSAIVSEPSAINLAAPQGITIASFAERIMSLAASYNNSLPYSLPAQVYVSASPSGTMFGDYMLPGTYNSNSLAAGILDAAGASEDVTQIQTYLSSQHVAAPGLETPVPQQYFGH